MRIFRLKVVLLLGSIRGHHLVLSSSGKNECDQEVQKCKGLQKELIGVGRPVCGCEL